MSDPAAKYVPRIEQWLRSLPVNAVIGWNDPFFDENTPNGPFVDIEVPPLLEELEVGWVWTIIPPDDDDRSALHIPLEYDVEGGWSLAHISTALSRWVDDHVGRSDVRFE